MGYLNDYLYRGTKPKPMPRPAPKRISTPAGERLSTILEGNSATRNGQSGRSKPLNRTIAQRLHLGVPPRASFEKRPPSYASQDGVLDGDFEGAASSRPSWFRRQISGRGGWKRLALVVAVILAIIIALGVGLGLGLSNNSSSSNGKHGSKQPQPFPAGAWTFDTYYTNSSTSCTSNSDSWRCYRDVSYSPATASESLAPLDWIISASSSSSAQFMISSSANPWSYTFKDKPLTLRDANTSNEHYYFTLTGLSKQVWPAVSLTGDNNRTTCFYNDTMLQASLYTHKPATLMMQTRSEPALQARAAGSQLNGPIFNQWQHAVQVEEISHGGNGIPACYRTYNNMPVGAPISLSDMSASSTCFCDYTNFAGGEV